MGASRRGLVLPVKALRALGLSSNASLEEARQAHRALAMRLHPDVAAGPAASACESEASARQRTEQLVVANAAREAIELSVRQGPSGGSWSMEARRQWDASTRRIHLSAMLGEWNAVLEAISCGVDANVRTPAQGAPPIFYAACCDFLGPTKIGQGDAGRLRVLEVLATNVSVDLSLAGRAMWAEGRTIYDLVSMGRCHDQAMDTLMRGRAATISMLSQGMVHFSTEGSLSFAE